MILLASKILAGVPLAFFQSELLLHFNRKLCKLNEVNLDKKQTRNRILIGALICYIGNFLLECCLGNVFLIKMLLEAAMLVSLGLFLFPGEGKQKWLGGGLVFAVMQVLHILSYGILDMIKSNMNVLGQTNVDAMLDQNIYNILIYIIFIGSKLYTERKTKQRFIRISLISCVFAVGQIIFYYYLFLSNPTGLTNRIVGIATICSIIVLFVHGAMLELMEQIVDNQKKQNEEEKKLLTKKYEYDYYLLAQEQTEAVKKLHEDMRGQLQAVQSLMKEEDDAKRKEAEDILGRLEEEVNHFGRVNYCEDAVLNTVLALKQEKARKLGIDMDILVDSLVQTKGDDIDLCSIVTNLLDNAIEATEKVKDAKKIGVRVGKRGGYLVLRVDNPMIEAPVKNKKGRFVSSKKETGKTKEHGRGLNIVEKTVEKYGGHLAFKEEKGRIVVTAFVEAEEGAEGE